jgi:activator of 2-hydroxyglutaryl-CoA dehydratase
MAGQKITKPVIFTGGVAFVPEMNKALQSALGHNIIISPEPQMTSDIGAAILAAKQLYKKY